jgi:hypothetical protein
MISGSDRRRDELTRLVERARRDHGPLEDVRDFKPYENDATDVPAAGRHEPARHRRRGARARKSRR